MRFSNDASWELEIDIEIEINLMRDTKYNWANSTCFLFQYTPFCVLLVTTWMKSPRADTSHQSGPNTSHSPHVVSPEHKRLNNTLMNNNSIQFFASTSEGETWARTTLSVGVSSPPARLKSVGKSRNFLTWAALLTTLAIFQYFSISVFWKLSTITGRRPSVFQHSSITVS